MTATMPDGDGHEATVDGLVLGDTDVVARLHVDRMAVVGNFYPWLSGRWAPTGDEYRARLRMGANGAVYVGIANARGATETFTHSEANTKLTYTAGSDLMVRFQMIGTAPTTVRVRVGGRAAEPTTWMQSFTDTTAALQGGGSAGLGFRRSGSESGGNATVSFDDFAVGAPS